ncbi:MAG: M10 family metallopeptidase C-terminal domain-containing protein, partial [Hyphomonas sp.]
TSAVSVNLTTGATSGAYAVGDTFSSIEGIIGSDFNDTLIGDSATNILRGGAGNDILIGNAGNDFLTGGAGADTFVYTSGAEQITDFEIASGDRVDVSAIAGMTSLAALQAIHTQVGSNSVFTFSAGNSVTLNNITLGQLNAGHFIFAASAEPQDETGKAEISAPTADLMDSPFDFSGLRSGEFSHDPGQRFLPLANSGISAPFGDHAGGWSAVDVHSADMFDFHLTPDPDHWQV